MKYGIMRYILVICLCAIGGGLSSVNFGPFGMLRGAVLGACLAAAFPAIDYLKSKGKCRSASTTALVGACFGLLAGLIICQTKIELGPDAIILVLNQPLLLIIVSVIYGFFIHLSLAVAINIEWRLPVYMGAMFFCHCCKYLFSYNDFLIVNHLIEALMCALIGFLPFAVLWGLPVARLLIVPQLDSNDNPSNQQGEKVS